MKALTWCTDIHLDFLEKPDDQRAVVAFAESLAREPSDGLLLTGDISLGPDVVRHLKILRKVTQRQIYFVCGNHDFYFEGVDHLRSQLVNLAEEDPGVKYLSCLPFQSLSPSVALVGHDGWYDAYWGEPFRSSVVMSDWFKIKDFLHVCGGGGGGYMHGPRINHGAVVALSRRFAAAAADHVYKEASSAAASHKTVIVATHVPPFPEVHLHEGKGGSPTTMPWYTSKLMGDALHRLAMENPHTHFEVFCGHTHGAADAQIESNLSCHVGGAEYGRPAPIGVIKVS